MDKNKSHDFQFGLYFRSRVNHVNKTCYSILGQPENTAKIFLSAHIKRNPSLLETVETPEFEDRKLSILGFHDQPAFLRRFPCVGRNLSSCRREGKPGHILTCPLICKLLHRGLYFKSRKRKADEQGSSVANKRNTANIICVILVVAVPPATS